MRLVLPSASFASLLAVPALVAALAGCGGGVGESSTKTAATTVASDSLASVGPIQDIRGPVDAVKYPSGLPLANMSDALVVGDHVIVRSSSDSFIHVDKDRRDLHPGTRMTVLDAQGRFLSTIDYGFELVPGYTGEWAMLPAPGGYSLVQLGAGSKLFQFDAQGKLVGPAAGVDLYKPPAADSKEQTLAFSAAAVDGNGFWFASIFVTISPTKNEPERVTESRIVLSKFDPAGQRLTPAATLWNSVKLSLPHVGASDGAVLVSWTDATAPMLAFWERGTGLPHLKPINYSGGFADLMPLALNGNGRLGVFSSSKGGNAGNLIGIQLDDQGMGVLPADAKNWAAEVLSSTWDGARRGVGFDVRVNNGHLLVADLVDEPPIDRFHAPGDILLLADYTLGSGALSASVPKVLRFKRPVTAQPFSGPLVMRQMVFPDHALLLIGDTVHLEGAVVSRQ